MTTFQVRFLTYLMIKKEKEPTETVFNWIEVQIQRESLDRLNKKLESV